MTTTAFAQRLVLAAVPLMSIIAIPSPARAAEPTPEAKRWFGIVRDSLAIPPATSGTAIASDDRGVLSGYYRLHIHRRGEQPVDVPKNTCKAALDNKLPGFVDLLFGRKYDLGLRVAASLDLRGDENQLPELPANRAELALFRLRQAGNNCSPDLSYFAGTTDYRTPWQPIGSIEGKSRFASLAFLPWATRLNNPDTVNLFWKGALAAASLIGPVGTLSAAIFGGKTSDDAQKERRSVAQGALGLGDIDGAAKPIWRSIPVSAPATANIPPFQPQLLNFDLALGKTDAPLFSAAYTVQVQYRASILLSEAETFLPLSADGRASILSKLGEIPEGPAEAIRNLQKQSASDAFGAACYPAMQALRTAGYSGEDQAAIVYSIATSIFPDDKLGSISCLDDFQTRLLLKRWTVTVPSFFRSSNDGEIGALYAKLTNALTAPKTSGAALAPNFYENVVLAGERYRLLGSEPASAGMEHSTGTPVKSAKLIAGFGDIAGGVVATGCSVSAREDASPDFRFPDYSEIGRGNDRLIAFPVVYANGSSVLMMVGTKGAVGTTGAIIDRIWIGTPQPKQEASLAKLKASMLTKPECQANPAIAALLAPAPPAP